MKFEWFISWRYLKRRRANFFVSAVTMIAVLGVAVGVMTVVVVLAVMTGFDKELEEKITKNLPPVIVRREGKIRDYEEVIGKLEKMEHVRRAVPFLQGEGLLKYRDRLCGVSVMGVDSDRQDVIADISRTLQHGRVDFSERVRLEGRKKVPVHGILLGRELAMRLGAMTGVSVQCISASLSKKSGSLVPSLVEYEVAGIFASGMYEVDNVLAYVSLKSAQELFKTGDLAGGIELKLDDIYGADEISRKVERALGPPFFATSWMERHRNLFSALRLEKTAMFVILALIILVAAFNISSTLIMVVIEKTKDVGILKSIGVANTGIMGIFVFEGMLIGLLGILLGLGGGFALCGLLKKYPIIRLPSDIYPIDRLPVQMSAPDLISISVVAFVMSLLAALYPAWKAGRVQPVEALRYE